ncbi:hypothetical protein HLB09_15910, partial [Pseudokineococcus marinus]|nr:hypothetical protein [Pseudokineococcus marinus]
MIVVLLGGAVAGVGLLLLVTVLAGPPDGGVATAAEAVVAVELVLLRGRQLAVGVHAG